MVIRSRAYQKVMPFCWHRLSKCGLLSSKWKTSVSVMGNAKSNCGFCNPFIVVPWSVFPVALFPLCDGCHEFTPFRAQATSKHLVLPNHHTTDRGVPVDPHDLVWPVRVQGLEVALATLYH